MSTVMRWRGALLGVLATSAVAASSASAQMRPFGYFGAPILPPGRGVLTNQPLYPGGPTLQQYTYNTAALGAAYSRVPPYALGYNPYPSVLNYGPSLNTYGGYGAGLYGAGLYGAGALGGYGYPGSALASSPYGAGLADPSLATTGGYGSAYPPAPAFDPFGGALRGVADVTTANANGLLTIERARITSQQANQAALDTRRRLFDEIRYERMNTPGAEDLRIKDIELNLRIARNDPPMSEIVSARSLNNLVSHLASQQSKGLRGPDIRLNEDLLKHVNLTNGANGNIGLLRNEGKLNWPLTLQSKDFEDLTKAVNLQIAKAAKAAVDLKPVDSGTLKDLKVALDKLNESLDAASARLTPNEYIESKRYLNMLGDTYRALQDPDVGNYFKDGKWTAQGNTVAEFVDRLTRSQGLRIAPASPGDEQYYRALQAALANYDAGITATTSK